MIDHQPRINSGGVELIQIKDAEGGGYGLVLTAAAAFCQHGDGLVLTAAAGTSRRDEAVPAPI